jgi:S-adenosylmethionine-diacylglycerol 3-amino-3-carboxypropyl transferase
MTGSTAATAAQDGASRTRSLLKAAVLQDSPISRKGLLERAFAAAFSGMVYPQIWEDPEVDMEALALGPQDRVVAIASGGCNAMSYLTASPAQVIAVDLNRHHVALVRLKIAAAQAAPNYATFFRMFGLGAHPENPGAYDRLVRETLDPETRAYWDSRDVLRRRRITIFSRGLYAQGLLGRFNALGRWMARRFGVDLSRIVEAPDVDAQRAFFDRSVAPLFDRPVVRWLTRRPASLFGLGIPPAQYDKLAGGRPMADVLRERLRRVACGFPMERNYFAWQAFTGGYAPGDAGPLPPYLQSSNFATLRENVARLTIENISVTDRLSVEPDRSLDAYVLLDAQDWMTDAQLNALWSQITRTARPGARVIFRTAGEPSILPGRVVDATLSQWSYQAERSRALGAKDRSGIYGGFHIYVRNDA